MLTEEGKHTSGTCQIAVINPLLSNTRQVYNKKTKIIFNIYVNITQNLKTKKKFDTRKRTGTERIF